MRRPARSLLHVLIVVVFLSGFLALAPEADEKNTPLSAVSKRESYVFASTADGLFRAPLATKRWERLKTPPEMPLDGKFASQPGPSPLIFYVALYPKLVKKPRGDFRYGLYLSRDNGATWELVSERDDFGAVLLHPDGGLFAVTGADGINAGHHILRSPDLGKTWRDITGNAIGQLQALEPDPDHPGLVRIHAWAIRMYTITAENEKFEWKIVQEGESPRGKLTSEEFFARNSSSSNRFYMFPATLGNYFQHDFGNRTSIQALDVVPAKPRFEFARGAPVVVPIRVVFHFDADAIMAYERVIVGRKGPIQRPTPPTEKLADQPGETDFWGLRVESGGERTTKSSRERGPITLTGTLNSDGSSVTTRSRRPAAKYEVFTLSPSAPYERTLDLGRFADFSKPGEYRVQLVYSSGGNTDDDNSVWDGSFTGPVFTVVVRE